MGTIKIQLEIMGLMNSSYRFIYSPYCIKQTFLKHASRQTFLLKLDLLISLHKNGTSNLSKKKIHVR